MKTKIDIKSLVGTILFSYESENNTLKETVMRAVSEHADLQDADLYGADLQDADLYGADLYGADLYGADLRGADLRGADLYGADLRGADLRGADLQDADLYGANLRGANLRDADLYGADLRGADLRGAKLKDLPQWFINLASRDMLFIFQSLQGELPYLREKLLNGEVSGTQYEGNCACLIGSLAKADGGLDKVCETIPFYDKGLHNPAENWFYQIREGDTPETNEFAKHALMLVDQVLGVAKPKKKAKK